MHNIVLQAGRDSDAQMVWSGGMIWCTEGPSHAYIQILMHIIALQTGRDSDAQMVWSDGLI